jgi:hypothetical protein
MCKVANDGPSEEGEECSYSLKTIKSSYTLKMEAEKFSETSVNYQATRRRIPDDRNLNLN